MFACRMTISLGINGGCDLNVANNIGRPLSGLPMIWILLPPTSGDSIRVIFMVCVVLFCKPNSYFNTKSTTSVKKC